MTAATSHPYRRQGASRVLGSSDALWARARRDVLTWAVKTRSGFRVDDPRPVEPGRRVRVTVRGLGSLVVEPVEVVRVVDEEDRAGFVYRTLPGHPVAGEEAFLVTRRGKDVVFTVRSRTRAAPRGPWRLAFPLLLVVQAVVRRRYLRALR